MKKYVRWGIVALMMVAVVVGWQFVRRVRLEKAKMLVHLDLCSPFDDPYYQGNAPIGGGPNSGAEISWKIDRFEEDELTVRDFISVKDLTADEDLPRQKVVKLKADHDYQITYSLPSRTENFNFDTAVFRIINCPKRISASSETSIVAVVSDGSTVLGSLIAVGSSEGSLQIQDGHTPYTIYREKSSRSLLGEELFNADGFMLRASAIDVGAPQHIVYTFRTRSVEEQVYTIDDGVGPMAPIKPTAPDLPDTWKK